MADQSELYGKEFEDNIQMGVGQVISKFRDKCEVKSGVTGESKSFGYVDSEDVRKKTTRHPDAISDDPNSTRCTAYLDYFYKKIMLDPQDELKMVADSKSVYVRTPLAGLNRKMDSIILDAARGNKYTGKNGTTQNALPYASKVAVSTTGLTLAKITSTLELFNRADVPEDEPKYWAMDPQQLSDLLALEKFTSADFSSIRALVPGKIADFMGFKFTLTNLLTKTSTTRFNIAWAHSGIGLAVGKEITGKIDKDPVKHFAWFTYSSMFVGATRIQDKKVIEIGCKEV